MSWVGNLMSLPYMVLFFLVWIVASVFRPILVATALAAFLFPSATLQKVRLFVITTRYLLFCNDKKWKKPKEDPASFFVDPSSKVDKKTIIFVRHGESTWNDTFNRGDRSIITFVLCFVPNLFKSIFLEWYFFVTGKGSDSWFYDSPLSEKGLRQAMGVRQFLGKSLDYRTPREVELMKLLLGQGGDGGGSSSSQIVSSNLRRAISTSIVGFQDRLCQKMEGDAVVILPQLQEISRNPDALSITPAKGKVVRAWTDPEELERLFEKQIDTRLHTGNKPVKTNGLLRMQEFCHVVFHDFEKETIIAVGHSLWFRSFFRTFLPHTVEHVSKKRKLINGGCVGFSLQRTETPDGGEQFMIDAKSITILYGGF